MITLEDIEKSYEKIKDKLILTPTTYSSSMSELLDCNVYLKLENLQRTGAYKFRGALNKLMSLSEEQLRRGVIAASAGNHSQGVALACKQLGVDCLIVMPQTAPLAKIQGTKSLGAKVILHGVSYNEACDHAHQLEKKENRIFVHPFADDHIMAGQGSVGLEIYNQVKDIDTVLVPIGGGGLISGVAVALKTLKPSIRIIGVESDSMSAMKASIDAKSLAEVDYMNSIADGISVTKVHQKSLDIALNYVDEIITVSEEEIALAIFKLLEVEKVVAEGAGAVSTAALLCGRIKDLKGKNVVVVVSGGNLDMKFLSKILKMGMAEAGRMAEFEVLVHDRPGVLSQVVSEVTKEGGNIIQVLHKRSSNSAVDERARIMVKIETTGVDHVQRIASGIKSLGVEVL